MSQIDTAMIGFWALAMTIGAVGIAYLEGWSTLIWGAICLLLLGVGYCFGRIHAMILEDNIYEDE